MKPVKSYTATILGECADRILRTEPNGQVMGCTSRGIFVMAVSRWVLFFTDEPWHGPLTISLDLPINTSGLKAGDFAKG